MEKKQRHEQKHFVMPDAYIIIFSIVVLASIATYLIPAGEYERETVDDVTRVIPNSYKIIESDPTGILEVFRAVQLGMIESANIIFLIFIIGGVVRSEEHTSELQSRFDLVCRLLLEKKKQHYLRICNIP